ncbi:hypothetical protein SBADM41S_07435 [Streptomyces badius]
MSAQTRPELVPLSFAQQRLWFLGELEGPNATYNIPAGIRLHGTLDTQALSAALNDVVARHEVLRTVFPTIDGQPQQHILDTDQAHCELKTVHVSSPQETAEAMAQAAASVFDLSADLPLRAWLIPTGPDEHILMLVLHHIAGDGWSMAPLAHDLSLAYTARTTNSTPAWQPLPVQYADYTLWQRDLLGQETDPHSVLARQLAYWRHTLADIPDELALPLDRPRPATATHHGGIVDLTVEPDTHTRLLHTARTHGVTLFMVLQAAMAALLSRLGAGRDIPLGVPVAGRSDEALENLIGFFVNTLVIRTDLTGDPTFTELLERVRDTGLGAYAHADIPFERLVEELAPTRSMARHPLFHIMLSLQNNAQAELDFPGLRAEAVATGHVSAKFDLEIGLSERFGPGGEPGGLHGSIIYATDLFDPSTAEWMAKLYARFLDAVTAAPSTPLGRVDILEAAERKTILEEWNDTEPHHRAEPPGASSASGRTHPRRGAVPFQDVAAARARPRRRHLRAAGRQGEPAVARLLMTHGVGPEMLVAVCMERSPDLVVTLLAVLKAGGAYVPIDPEYPADRIAHVLDDARPAVVLTSRATDASLGAAGTGTVRIVVDDPRTVPVLTGLDAGPVDDAERTSPLLPFHPAYVIYTSGSRPPKGVTVPHRAVTTSSRRWATAAAGRARPSARGHHRGVRHPTSSSSICRCSQARPWRSRRVRRHRDPRLLVALSPNAWTSRSCRPRRRCGRPCSTRTPRL